MVYPSEEERTVCDGSWGTIEYAVRSNDTMPAKEFIEELSDADITKLFALFERLANSPNGKLHNREQFKKVDGTIFEFKKFQIRIGCFQIERTWFLTHGFIKKSDNWPESQLTRAVNIRAEHIGRKRPSKHA